MLSFKFQKSHYLGESEINFALAWIQYLKFMTRSDWINEKNSQIWQTHFIHPAQLLAENWKEKK